MNERQKLEEAYHFLNEAKGYRDQPSKVKHSISGFVNAARSVVQFAFEECKAKDAVASTRDAMNWYEVEVKKYSLLTFFRDLRNQNIHKKPIATKTDVNIHTFTPAEPLSIQSKTVVTDREGKVLEELHSDNFEQVERERAQMQPSESSTTFNYFFDAWQRPGDWQGPDDALTLAEQYLIQLDQFVTEGVSNGHISP